MNSVAVGGNGEMRAAALGVDSVEQSEVTGRVESEATYLAQIMIVIGDDEEV